MGERERESVSEKESGGVAGGGSQVRHQHGLLPFPQRSSLLPLRRCECASDGSSPFRRLKSKQGAKPLPLPSTPPLVSSPAQTGWRAASSLLEKQPLCFHGSFFKRKILPHLCLGVSTV